MDTSVPIFAFYIIFPFIVFLLYNKHRGVGAFVVSVGIAFMCQMYFMTDKFVTEGFVMAAFIPLLPSFFSLRGLIYLYRDEIVNLVKAKKVASIICCITLTVSIFGDTR